MADTTETPLFVPDQVSLGSSFDISDLGQEDTQAAQWLENALVNLGKGNVKAAVIYAADAINLIAETHSINGNAWY